MIFWLTHIDQHKNLRNFSLWVEEFLMCKCWSCGDHLALYPTKCSTLRYQSYPECGARRRRVPICVNLCMHKIFFCFFVQDFEVGWVGVSTKHLLVAHPEESRSYENVVKSRFAIYRLIVTNSVSYAKTVDR